MGLPKIKRGGSRHTFKMPVKRRFNSFFDSTRGSIFLNSKAVSTELPDAADKGLKSFVDYEYPELTKEVLTAMVTPSAAHFSPGDHQVLVPFTDVSLYMKIWNTVITILSVIEGFYTPIITAFPDAQSNFLIIYFKLISFFFGCDIIFTFTKSYKGKNGLPEARFSKVAEKYITGWFLVDVLTVIVRWVPFEEDDFMTTYDPSDTRSFTKRHFFRNLVLLQAGKNFFFRNHFAQGSEASSFAGLLRIMISFFFLIHCYGMFFFFITSTEDSTFYSLQQKNVEEDWFVRYTEYFLGAFYILTGKPTDLTTTREKWVGIVGSMIGLLGQAYLLGEVTLLLHKLNARQTKWRLALEELNDSMDNMKLSRALRKRVRNAYAYWWAINGGQTKNEWLSLVSPELKTEVFLQVNKQLLLKVPLFKDGKEAFLMAVTERLTTELYLPGGYVILHGEFGSEMYFIVYGTLQAMNKEETTVYALMSDGMFFGEISLLNPNTKRTATVRSFTYSQLSKLTKEDLDLALQQVPDSDNLELQGLQQTAKERQENTTKVEEFNLKQQRKMGKSPSIR